MIKKNLSVEERMALAELVEMCRDLHIFVDENEEDDCLCTTGEPLDLYCFFKKDWELCLNAMEN